MNKIKVFEERHEVFGNCIKIDNDVIELLVTIDFGPRIIHFSRKGMDNLFYQDKNKGCLGEKQEIYDDIIRLYGGHRLWISPEVMPRCYYPDNLPVEYEIYENGAKFTAPVEKINNIQKSIVISMDEKDPFVRVEHFITNCGNFDIELAPWAITMMSAGAKEIIPMPKTKTGFLPNRTLVLWDYTDMSDKRVHFGKDYIMLKQDEEISNAFKIGLNNEDGWAAVFNKNQLFLKFFTPNVNGFYPDGGCCYETYTNDVMLESETLGEISILAPGDSISHIEEWEVYKEDDCIDFNEEAVYQIISKYIKL